MDLICHGEVVSKKKFPEYNKPICNFKSNIPKKSIAAENHVGENRIDPTFVSSSPDNVFLKNLLLRLEQYYSRE